MEKLEACGPTTIAPGDAIIIRTPTGGGYGSV
jgi:N-methylhydantoinase B/oxoprolinase/acetone carboxylase alpha subunit